MKKIILNIAMMLFLTLTSNSQVWEKLTNIPAPYNSNYWLDVMFLKSNPNYGWICGFNGRVLRSTDGGNTWTGTTISVADHLESINFTSTSVGYVSGPSGVYKSTDGGASFTSITPVGAFQLWGNYFVDDNYGIVVGGGCGDNTQRFWRTTDGGTTWTVFTGNEPNSGMTHVLLYSTTGIGYASSSGKIWKTTDGGITWSIFSTTGINLWQESIDNIGGSFIVPYSGTTCSGGGTAGGMRFSTDAGASWNLWNTGQPMFGTKLLTDQKAWAVGYRGSVYYTTNGGLTWINRNCGIENEDDLDDCFFFDENNGFAVGENIYRLGLNKILYSKNELKFSFACIPDETYDTLKIINKSFFSSNFTVDLLSGSITDYQLLTPNSPFTIGPCDSTIIIIKFHPTSTGVKNAVLRIIANGTNYKDFNLSGTGLKSTAQNQTGDVILDKMRCGTKKDTSVVWSCDNDLEELTNLSILSGTGIYCNTIFPLKLTKNGNKIDFTIVAKDTGWSNCTFKVVLEPCGKEYVMNFRVYGISPIINTVSPRNIFDFCKAEQLDTMPVWNTGNDDLIINNAYFLNPNFKVIGFLGKKYFPDTIKVGKFDSLVVKFIPPYTGKVSAPLTIINNDSTKTFGNKNPLIVNYFGEYYLTDLKARDSIFDFGDICINDSKELSTTIINKGNLKAFLRLNKVNPDFDIYSTPNDFPIPLGNNDSAKIFIKFAPKKVGNYLDSLIVYSDECGQSFKVIVKGRAVSADAYVVPDPLSILLQSNINRNDTISLKSLSDINLKVKKVSIKPTTPTLTFNYTLPEGDILKAKDSLKVALSFISTKDEILNLQLCIELEGLCSTEICVPLKIITMSNWTEMDKDTIDFGTIRCDNDTLNHKYFDVNLSNLGQTNDTVTSITFAKSNSKFNLVGSWSLPYILKSKEKIRIVIDFNSNQDGIFEDSIIVITKNFAKPFICYLKGNKQISNIALGATTIDFGKFEHCQFDSILKFTFYNNSILPDSVTIIRNTPLAEISILENYSFEILGKDSAKISIKLNPGLSSKLGISTERIFVKLPCNAIAYFDVSYELIAPKLLITPQELDYGILWIGDSITKSFNISNPTKYDITVTDIFTQPRYSYYEISQKTPFLMLANSSKDIDVKFKSEIQGDYKAQLRVQYQSKCIDSSDISLKAISPKEEYKINFETGDYKIKPGEGLVIESVLKDSVYKLLPDEIEFTYAYDEYLFMPGEVKYLSDGAIYNVPFTNNIGKLTFRISGDHARKFFAKADTCIFISGITLLSYPRYTPIEISSLKIINSNNYVLTQKKGSLEIIDFCYKTAENRIILMPEYAIISVNQDNSNCKIRIKSDREFETEYMFYDILADKCLNSKIKIESGTNDIKIDVSNLPAGVYFIKIGNKFEKFVKF